MADGVEVFIAKDLAEEMGYTWTGSRMDHVPHEWKLMTSVVTSFEIKPALALTEAGLNFFLNRSDKECAIPLQKWIAGEVLQVLAEPFRGRAPRRRRSICAGAGVATGSAAIAATTAGIVCAMMSSTSDVISERDIPES